MNEKRTTEDFNTNDIATESKQNLVVCRMSDNNSPVT